MNHNTIELPQSYYDNPQEYKRCIIKNWRISGVIYDDWDDLYEVYMNTMECQYCKKPFETSRHRCLDHDHNTGLFRMILCQGCNTKDSHLRHTPEITKEEKYKETRKAYQEQNRDKIFERTKKYRDNHKEETKSKYEANKEQLNLQRRAKYEANKEQINIRRRAYKKANKEKLNKENQLK
jgi:hypothetical protein